MEITGVLPKPSNASTNIGRSCRREKSFQAFLAGSCDDLNEPCLSEGQCYNSSINALAKGEKMNNDDEQIEEEYDENDNNEGGNDEQEDSEGDDGAGRSKKDKQGGDDMEGCDCAGDSGVAAALGDDGAVCKKQRGSEDPYMVIYVWEGLKWGIGGEREGDTALPEHVLASNRLWVVEVIFLLRVFLLF